MVIANVETPLYGTVAEMLAVKGSHVHSVEPTATVYDAIAMMDARRCGALLVMHDEKVLGIISERDDTRKVILRGRASRDTRVEEIMTRDLITVQPHTSLGECLQIVTDRGIRHLPVTDGDKLMGLVSIGDLVRAVVAQQAETITSLKTYIGGDYPT
jgi:CBS domain-containing protein